jgi:hypothetical protein
MEQYLKNETSPYIRLNTITSTQHAICGEGVYGKNKAGKSKYYYYYYYYY